jgi:hypothetical protein
MSNNNDGGNGNETPAGLYEDLPEDAFIGGNILGTGIRQTPTVSSFPSWAVEQDGHEVRRYEKIPDVEVMKNGPLFGLPMRSFLTGQVVEDSTIEMYIQQAISQIEHTLDIYINPVTFVERHDYSREMMFYSFGVTKLHHAPIINVESYELTFNNGIGIPGSVPLVKIPNEFIHVQPSDGTIQIVPAQGVTISGFIVSIYSGLGFHAFNSQAISAWPGAVLVKYRAGFEKHKVPAMMAGLIQNIAAFKFLSTLGPVLFPYNSTSVGIDGTSQSVSTPGPLFLQNRLKDLATMIQTDMEAARGYYQKRFLVDALSY